MGLLEAPTTCCDFEQRLCLYVVADLLIGLSAVAELSPTLRPALPLALGDGLPTLELQFRHSTLLFPPILCYLSSVGTITLRLEGAAPMEWTTPQHEEIDLNCEISSYANAEL